MASPNSRRKDAARANGKPGGPVPVPAPADPHPEPLRAIDLLHKIKSGEVLPDKLRPEDRQDVVALMTAEGASASEIAHVLKVADRTIERDRKAIAQRNALKRDPSLTGTVLGRLFTEAELDIQQLRRLARDKDIEPSVRTDAYWKAFQILDQLCHRLQSAGYMDRAAQQLQADLTHHGMAPGAIPSHETISAELERLAQIDPSSPQIAEARALLDRARAATVIDELNTSMNKGEESRELQS